MNKQYKLVRCNINGKDVEQIVDDGIEQFGIEPYYIGIAQQIFFLVVVGAVDNQVGVFYDCVERCGYLAAHVVDKFGFAPFGVFCGFVGFDEFLLGGEQVGLFVTESFI